MAKSPKPPNQQAAAWLLAAWEQLGMDGTFKLHFIRGVPVAVEVYGRRSLLPITEELKPVQHGAEGE